MHECLVRLRIVIVIIGETQCNTNVSPQTCYYISFIHTHTRICEWLRSCHRPTQRLYCAPNLCVVINGAYGRSCAAAQWKLDAVAAADTAQKRLAVHAGSPYDNAARGSVQSVCVYDLE